MGEKKKTGGGGHQALYRKYRSKSLDEIKGQEHITTTLSNALKKGKISHAYLFTGPRGTGKTSIARILAHEINGLPYTDEVTHLDIIEIDAASNRRIDDIRDLRDKVTIAPVSAKYKVYIIDEVHMLTSESFNALLKTLEEPPKHVVFILATTEVHKLPATIISRAQRHSFRLIPKQQVAQHLAYIAEQEAITAQPDALELLAEHGGGSFRDSISLLDQLGSSGEVIDRQLVELLLGVAPREALDNLLEASIRGDTAAIFEQLDSILGSGLTPGGVATQLAALLREKLRLEGGNNLIEALDGLLAVHTAQYPRLKLETVLLRIAPRPQIAAPKTPELKSQQPASQQPAEVKTKQSVTEPEPVKNTSAKPAQEKSEESTTADSNGDGMPEAQWVKILEAIKAKNNPLYTVLRLATPEVSDTNLTLIFNFPFHQKKVDEAKHKKLIAETAKEVTGLSLVISTVVDKNRARPPAASTPAKVDTAHASLISNVQDIMGGGEVVNV